MADSSRPLRVADQIQAELSDIIRRRLKDPRRGFMTITGVDVSRDLRSARVFVSALDEDAEREALGLLEHARGFLRSELGKRLTLRFVPELHFRADHSAARGRRIEDLLRDLRREKEVPPEGDSEA